MKFNHLKKCACILILYFLCSSAFSAENGKAIFSASCASCHNTDMPEPASLTLEEKINRKAPPLYYAGLKYQQKWLEKWLTEPDRITPSGGELWSKYVIVTDEGDEIDETKLPTHPAVSENDAQAISAYLMTLKAYPDLIKNGEYTPAKAGGLAKKDFRKFKGCVACHRDEKDFGGVTGPELYTAMERLQPEYIASFVRNPSAWEPRSLMPNKKLNDASIYKIMNYLNTLKGKE